MGLRSYWKNSILNFWESAVNTTFKTGVWADCPLLAIVCDPTTGYIFFEDFLDSKGDAIATTNMDGWTVTQATTGAVDLSDTAQGGVLEMDSNSTTATQGVQIQYTEGTLPFIPVAGQDIWFEAKVKVVDTYDKCELFIGLSEADTSIIATSAVSPSNFIGWQCVTDDGVLLFASEKADTGTTTASNTIAEATWVRLGFHVNGVTDITHYVDGVAIGTSILTANIPILGLTPSFVCQSGGTNDPILHIDWMKIVQIRA